MASSTLAHRAAQDHVKGPIARVSTPRTPRRSTLERSISSQIASPGSVFAIEDDAVVYAFGARTIHAGFAGESVPRHTLRFGPEQAKRVDDYLLSDDDCASTSPAQWELWSLADKTYDLGLLLDKLERALRQTQNDHFLLDPKARKVVAVVPHSLPSPLLEVIVKSVFQSAQRPTHVTLLNNPLASLISSGLRSGLGIDIGWHETTVSVIYEYRDVAVKRSRCAGRAIHDAIRLALAATSGRDASDLPFTTIEQYMERCAYVRSHSSDMRMPSDKVLVMSTLSGIESRLSAVDLATAIETAAFGTAQGTTQTWDDDALPLQHLAYQCLSHLPLDVRGACISRIVITGGPSKIPGLKPRILAEIARLIEKHAWDPVLNYGSATNKKVSRSDANQQRQVLPPQGSAGHEDPMESASHKAKSSQDDQPAEVRGVHTLGAWAGGSIFAHLKLTGTVEIKVDDFMKHGLVHNVDIL